MKNAILKIFAVILTGFITVGCGGGGGSSSSEDLVTITTNNAEEVIKGFGLANRSAMVLADLSTYVSASCENGSKDNIDKGGGVKETTFNDCKVTGENVILNGKILYKAVTSNYIDVLEFNNFDVIKNSSKEYEYNIKSGDIYYSENSSSAVIKSNATLTYRVNNKKSELNNVYTQFDVHSSNVEEIVNGNVKFYSVGKWSKITTQTKIAGNSHDDCPTSGKVLIEGANNSKIEIVYNSDLTVSVGVNENDFKKYSCDEFNSKFYNYAY